MEFTFTTAYDQKALTAMAHTLRKTIRKKHSRRSHIFGWIVIVLGLLVSLPVRAGHFQVSFRNILTWGVVLILLIALILEDSINGYVARRRGLPGLDHATTTFAPEGYHSSTNIGSSDFPYSNIVMLAETNDYFVFIFSKNHAQVYDKSSITGGDIDSFRKFIQEQTGQTIQRVR